jgi:hypothetical protein
LRLHGTEKYICMPLSILSSVILFHLGKAYIFSFIICC